MVHKEGVFLYLIKRNQTFHYRARIPADLIPILGKREVRFSLKTANRKKAKKIAKALSQRLHTALSKVSAGKTETRNRYTKGYGAKELYEECILKLDYEVDLSGLNNE